MLPVSHTLTKHTCTYHLINKIDSNIIEVIKITGTIFPYMHQCSSYIMVHNQWYQYSTIE